MVTDIRDPQVRAANIKVEESADAPSGDGLTATTYETAWPGL